MENKKYNSFIYIWRNKITKQFYIGKHFGDIGDGYICSSKTMLKEYKANPSHFRRKILEYIQDINGDQLMAAEKKWLAFIEKEELGNKYYNFKKDHFGNTRGCKKSYVWNQGLTRAECEEYQELRKNKLFYLLSERPTRGTAFKPITDYICPWCSKAFRARGVRIFCSLKCSTSNTAAKQKLKPSPLLGRPAWNKGIPDPNGRNNGIKGAQKQSATVTGRKIAINAEGKRYWTYPDKDKAL